MTETKSVKTARKAKKPRRIDFGCYSFIRIEGRFRKSQTEVAQARFYPGKEERPFILYAEEARRVADWLNAFADWADEQ